MDEMQGKVCVVTGSNSGIGKETALALAHRGATVVMAARSQERGEAAISEIVAASGNQATALMVCDLSSMASIRRFADEFWGTYDRLHVLINNAGAVFSRRQTSVDGFELTFAVNYLGPFLLTHALLPVLKASAPSRVINVGSGVHTSGQVDLEDLQSDKHYRGMAAYANAKLMLVLYTYTLATRLAGSGVTVNVVQPGFVATRLGRNSGSRLYGLGFALMRPFQISARMGAETSVYLAASEAVEGVTGKCFAKKREVQTASASYDQSLQTRLWAKTMDLLELAPSTADS
jgi:NAD(P)-dependent dehydrogenase (short-subunit alcohol dehydrogenase family)